MRSQLPINVLNFAREDRRSNKQMNARKKHKKPLSRKGDETQSDATVPERVFFFCGIALLKILAQWGIYGPSGLVRLLLVVMLLFDAVRWASTAGSDAFNRMRIIPLAGDLTVNLICIPGIQFAVCWHKPFSIPESLLGTGRAVLLAALRPSSRQLEMNTGPAQPASKSERTSPCLEQSSTKIRTE
jgi:hypothetical protein